MAINDASRQKVLAPSIFATDKQSATPPWILRHIFDCQVSQELPLRVMFSFNAGHRLPSLNQARQWWRYDRQGKLVLDFLSSVDKTSSEYSTLSKDKSSQEEGYVCAAGDHFMDKENEAHLDISKLLPPESEQIKGLPTTFVHSFCLRVFAKEFDDADWGLALTGMDYLRDFEYTRRTVLRDAAKKLGITEENWRDILREYSDARTWVEQVQIQELRLEGFYAKLFIDLRIWTMINQLKAPYSKADTLAMLNTLFPPSVRELPNERLSPKILYKYRATFYRHAMAASASDHKAVDAFLKKLLRPGSRHSWEDARQNLEVYLELADCMIQQARAVHGITFFRDSYSGHSRTLSDAHSSYSDCLITPSSGHTSFEEEPAVNKPSHHWTQLKSLNLGEMDDTGQARMSSRRKASGASGTEAFFACQEAEQSGKGTLFGSRDESESRSTIRYPPSVRILPAAQTASLRYAQRKSKPLTPLLGKWSDAAHHESFSRSVTPLADPRVLLHQHRSNLSSPRVSNFLEIRNKISNQSAPFKTNPPTPTRAQPILAKVATVLPSDNLAFLQKPYEPQPPPQDVRARLRRAASGVESLRENFKTTGLGIRLKPTKSMENIQGLASGAGGESQKPRRTLRSTISQVFSKSPEQSIEDSSSARTLEIIELSPPERRLRSKMSLPALKKKMSFSNLGQSRGLAQSSTIVPNSKEKMPFSGANQSSANLAQSPSMSIPSLRLRKSFVKLDQSSATSAQSPTRSIPTLKKKQSFAKMNPSSFGSSPSPSTSASTLKKKQSYASLVKSPTLSPYPTVQPSPTIVAIDEPWTDFKETNDTYERLALHGTPGSIPRIPSTCSLDSANDLDKIVERASLRNITLTAKPQPLPRRLFGRIPSENTALIALEHPPPRKLRSPSTIRRGDSPTAAWGLEYSRAWFLKEARSKRYGTVKQGEATRHLSNGGSTSTTPSRQSEPVPHMSQADATKDGRS